MYRALLVCNSAYPEDTASLPELHGPQRDGLVVWGALTDQLTGRFQPEYVRVLFERTSSEVLNSAEIFFKEAEDGDVLLFYFSGHGKRDSGELVLCARNTVAQNLLSTGVPSGSLKKMITTSHASAVIVFLDCCHSGAFLKGQQVAHDLAGEGIFVVAAVRASEVAPDSQQDNSSSPFTQVLVEGLTKGAKDLDGDGLVDLDDLYNFLHRKLARTGYGPEKDFNGSGRIAIARRTSENDAGATQPLEGEPNQSPHKSSQETVSAPSPSPANFLARLRWRTQGDYSLGDLRTWAVCLILALSAAVASLLAFRGWDTVFNSETQSNVPDPRRYASIVAMVLALLIALVSSIEGWKIRIKPPMSRRAALELLNSPTARRLRRIRHTLVAAGTILVFTPFFGIEQVYGLSWAIALSCLGALSLISIFSEMRYGDAAYVAASALIFVALVVPMEDSRSALGTAFGGWLLSIVLVMVTVWLTKGPVILFALPVFLSGVIVLNLGASTSLEYAAIVSLVGTLLALAACILGCGRTLDSITSVGS